MIDYILRGIHLLAMGLWFGASITSPLDILRTLRRGRPYTELVADQVQLADKIMVPAAVLTLLSGLVLMYETTGFGDAPWRFWAGLGGTVVLALIGKLGLDATKKRIVRALTEGGEAAQVTPLSDRFVRLVIAWHVVFLAVFVLMVYPF
jgi:hypothetical protein